MLRVLLRRLAASPGFTTVSVLTLAIGIGASLAIFTIVNAVLLRPLPLPDADRLVVLRHTAPGLVQLTELPMSDALYFLYATQVRSLDGVALFNDGQTSFTGPDNPQRVTASVVTPSFFEVVRTPPRLGRGFSTADGRVGASPVVVLSNGLWQTRFGGDPGVIGRMVEISGDRVEIVGVMPSTFTFPTPETQLWQPLRLDENDTQLGNFSAEGLARLGDGLSAERLHAELTGLASNLVDLFPDDGAAPILANAGFRPQIVPLREFVVGDTRATLWILLGAVGFLLLIACANVANLFLARAEARHRELAIRVALGENRARLVGTTLVEGVVLGILGGLVATPVASGAVRLLVRFGPENLPRAQEISVDGVVLGFGLALSVVAGLLFGLLPALRAGIIPASSALRDGARGASAGRRRHLVRRGLVIAQIALALTLLVGSGLAVRSFQKLDAVDPGFDPGGVLTFRVSLPERQYKANVARSTFVRELIERLSGLPGVERAAAVSEIPFGGSLSGGGHALEDQPRAEGEVPPVFMRKNISPGYFEAMRIPIIEGREFDRLDEERDAPVAIVTNELARTYWPGESALGKGLRANGPPDADGEDWFRVVGVVGDVRQQGLDADPLDLVYYPLALEEHNGAFVPPGMIYVVRAAQPDQVTGAARAAVRALDPNLPISDMVTLDTLVARSRSERAFVMTLLIIASAFALLLGGIGLYGVISYVVAQRGREIAIRMAIGAQLSDIRRLVLVEAGWIALVGTALGIAAAVALTRRLQALLFETSPLDPVVFATVSTLLVGICLLASWLPARRATRVQPVTALRAE